ncbi:MAG: hypothetical protein MMC33_004818 [Icmadophila ericetorum]|nr:hypothetical protein [Icmadophila ericetorum]
MGSLGSEATRGVFMDYESHSSNTRLSTIVTLAASLREHHPGTVLSIVNTSSCDLASFAQGGHATISLDTSKDPISEQRFFKATSSRTAAEGVLKSAHAMAKYDYLWEGHNFIVYSAYCSQSYQCDQTNYFILHKIKNNDKKASKEIIDNLILAISKWALEFHHEIFVFDAGYWSRSKELWEEVLKSSWDDVILDKTVKAAMKKDIEGFFDSEAAYKRFGIQWKRGIIFHGLPGNGKTISIKALMNTLASREDPIPSLYVKSFNSSSGDQVSINMIFSKAREMAPCFLILEDIDSLVSEANRSYFLNEVDGLQSNDGIMILGTTNHLDKLDPAIVKRPSRFDRKYPFQSPTLSERILYSQYWVKKLKSVDEVTFDAADCEAVAKATEGFTFAYLKEAFVATLFHLFAHQGETVDLSDNVSLFVRAFTEEVATLRVQMSEDSEEDAKQVGAATAKEGEEESKKTESS